MRSPTPCPRSSSGRSGRSGRRSVASLAFALVLLAALGWGASPRAEAAGNDLTGRMAPEISVPLGIHGLPSGASLASFRGKVVVLKFFFVGCPVCRDSFPLFQDLYTRYAPLGVQFIGIAYDERTTVERYLDSHGFTFPVAIDSSGLTSSRYGVRSYPTHYVIGADGYVKAYDTLATWVLDRELGASRAKANVDELGSVPAALSGAIAAAQDNDYGLVLRVVEPHLDAAKDGPDVAAAAVRLQGIAKVRFERRLARVRARFDSGDRNGAIRDAEAVVVDFRDTSVVSTARDLAQDLQRRVSGARLATR